MKITKRQLRKLINEVAHRSRRQQRTSLPSLANLLLEASTITGPDQNINDLDPDATWAIMTSGDDGEAQEFIKGVSTAEVWAAGALKKQGYVDGESLKARAEKIWGKGDEGKSVFAARVNKLKQKLKASEGFAKPEMPALEPSDVDAVADALSEPGDLNIDIGADFGGNTEKFADYVKKDVKKDDKKDDKKDESLGRSAYPIILERWNKLAGINEINKDVRFPFPGANKVMPGAPNLGATGKVDPSKIGGMAKKFLTKGKGNTGDDLKVVKNQPMKGAAMIPTQTNVLAAKSMLFALADIGKDMGAFASSDDEIIDGHHRWSGQYLRHGDKAEHTGVHVIEKGTMSTPEFLTMLTVVGNALGRPTKGKVKEETE